MTAHAVVEVVDLLDAAGVACWVDGGWGVDALLGRQTRAHADLDLVVDVAQLDRVRHALGGAGFTVLRDWLPTAIASAHSDGREVDLHPVTRTSGGGGSQELSPAPPFHYGPPASGVVDRRRVACVDGDTQLRAHLGYPPTAKDRADVRALAQHLGVDPPAPYG